MIEVFHQKDLIATFQKENSYILEYKNQDIQNSISLSLPNSQKFYIYEKFPPYFETFLPEGYLFEIFKNYLTKEFGYIDDYLLFELLSPNIENRICYKSSKNLSKHNDIELSIENILENDTKDTFSYLVETFFDKNAISGVQPKSLAILRDKESLTYKNYIVKTWGEEFSYLAENEYLTMKTLAFCGVEIPNISL